MSGARKHRHLAVSRRLTYFGFELETVMEELRGAVPPDLQEQARDALTDALMSGDTPHPDQGRIRRALSELGELWRRSGGTLEQAGDGVAAPPDSERAGRGFELAGVPRHAGGARCRRLVDGATRARLLELPSMVRLLGDAVPLDYEVEDGEGVVVLRLREGQLRRLKEEDLAEGGTAAALCRHARAETGVAGPHAR